MRKTKIFIAWVIVLSVFVGINVPGVILAKEQPEGKPFQEIWQAINDLRNEMLDLANKILAIENWKALVENWKTEIENWKNWANEKIALFQEKITDLSDRVSTLEEPTALLENIKTVDGSGSGLDADLLDGYDSSEFLSVPWARLKNFPPDCPAGQYVYGLSGTLKCGIPASGIKGTGLDNYIPRWNGTSILENSVIYQTDSGNVGIGITAPRRSLDVNGEIVAVNRLTLAQDTSRSSLTWHLDNYGGRFRIFYQPNIDTPGVEKLTITTGNIGIGTAWPVYTLDVNGDIRSTAYIRGNSLCIGNDCRTAWPTGNISGSGTTNYVVKFVGSTNVGNSVIYDNGTNVGIGTTTPGAKLEVNGQTILGPATGGYHMIINDIPTAKWALGTGSWKFHIANDYPSAWTERLVITQSGNVGIGVTDPGAKLEVNGNVKINSGGSANRVVCWKSDGKTLGYCSTQPDENGSCVCN